MPGPDDCDGRSLVCETAAPGATARVCAGGFALLDVLLAMALLASTLTGLAGLMVWTAHANRHAARQALAVALASARMEQLEALAWGYDANGAEVTDTTTDLSLLAPQDGGAGLRPSPPGSLEYNSVGYTDHVDAAGGWLGNGTDPPPGTRFTRRWSIQPLPESPSDSLVLRVAVFDGVLLGRVPPCVAHVAVVRTRRAQ